MPETISFWWAVGGYVVGIVINVFSFGWVLRGFKGDLEKIARDAASAAATARSVEVAHGALALDVGLQGGRLDSIEKDHEEMKDLVMLKLPNMVEGAISRAAESASKAAWHRKRRT
jgi:hypothetical protein